MNEKISQWLLDSWNLLTLRNLSLKSSPVPRPPITTLPWLRHKIRGRKEFVFHDNEAEARHLTLTFRETYDNWDQQGSSVLINWTCGDLIFFNIAAVTDIVKERREKLRFTDSCACGLWQWERFREFERYIFVRGFLNFYERFREWSEEHSRTRPGVQQCQAQGLVFCPWLGLI